jgi:AcrR family transcriptional regulator
MLSNELVAERIDPRVKRTRAMIADAFSEVLHEKGFQAISVQDITERAGINRTTFYLHFTDKYDLLDYNIAQLFRGELEKRSLNLCHFTPENMRSLIITLAEFILYSNSHCSTNDPQFEALVEVQVKQQVQDLLQVWSEKKGFGVDSKTYAIAGSWALYGLAQDWSHDKKHANSERFAEKIMPILYATMGLEE